MGADGDPMDGLRIGEVARRAGVSVEAIRFYERKGLVPEPPRRPSGYRQYPLETVARVCFIRRAGALGFSLREVGELLELRAGSVAAAEEMRRKATAKVRQMDQRIAELRRMRDALAELAERCRRAPPTAECPILEAFESAQEPPDGEGSR